MRVLNLDWCLGRPTFDHDFSVPRLMRVGSKKDGKTYRGVREGGISDNTTYYVFTHAKVFPSLFVAVML